MGQCTFPSSDDNGAPLPVAPAFLFDMAQLQPHSARRLWQLQRHHPRLERTFAQSLFHPHVEAPHGPGSWNLHAHSPFGSSCSDEAPKSQTKAVINALDMA